MKNKRRIFIRCHLMAFLFACFSINALSEDVYFQGFALSGSFEDREINFPYLNRISGIMSDDGSPLMDRLLRDIFFKNVSELHGIDLKAEKASGSGSKNSLAFAMTGERISVEPVGGVYKCCINLSGQILILDFSTMMVAGSYPVIWEIIHVFDHLPAEDDIMAVLAGSQYGIRSEFFSKPIVDILPQISVKDYAGRTVRILDVDIADEAVPFLSVGYAQNLSAYKAWVAEQFGMNLSSDQGLALLPYAKDEANARMALSFSNTEMLMFTIPSPTYGISIRLDKFKKVVAQETLAERLMVYGAYVTVKLFEPEFGKIYYEAPFKFGVPKTIPASQSEVDDFSVFREALKNVLQKAGFDVMKDKQARKVLEKCKRS